MEARAVARPLKLAIVIALVGAAVATPCSFDVEPRLYFDVRPDAPIKRYVDGNLGLLQPLYARSHLVVAYRYLSGRPPTAVERDGFAQLLEHRLDERSLDYVPPAERWERLRVLIRGVQFTRAPERSRAIEGEEYEWIDNCTDDAFNTAAATLADRVKTFGATSEAVDAWLDAQEIVFGNCAEGEGEVPPAAGALPALIRADRQYQMAAADFYAFNFERARKRFQDVARDSRSPWRATARLVATRALIRADSLAVTVPEDDPLGVAQEELRAMLSDRSMASMHDAAWGLLAYITARRNPQQRYDEAVQGLLRGEPTARRARTDLADYTVLWDKEVTGDDELTDWVRTFQGGDLAHARERFKVTRGKHWLVAALTHVKTEDAAAAAELLAASKNIGPDYPGYAAVVYHRARLMSDHDATRAELDRVLSGDLPASARNHLLRERRALARSLREYLRDLPATLVGEGLDAISEEDAKRAWLPPDATVALNLWMPLQTLKVASTDPSLPDDIRARLARMVEVRSALLTKPDFDLALAYVKDPLRRPYVQPFHYDDEARPHWWCATGPRVSDDVQPDMPLFLTTPDLAGVETKKLQDLGSGATWILRTVLGRAESHPADPRVPEALSLAVTETRWACGDKDTDQLAEQAFNLLHRRYAKTEWAQQTKYWYRAEF